MNELTIRQNNVELMNSQVEQCAFSDLYTNTLTEVTKKNYTSAIKGFFGVDDLNDITVKMMQSVTVDTANVYAHQLLAQGLEKSTINSKLAALHSFYKFLCRRNVGIMTYNPFEPDEGSIRFKNALKGYSDKRALTPFEVKRLFKAVDIDGAIGNDKTIAYRDLIVLQILTTAGLRRAELCNIVIGDIKRQQGEFVIEVLGKGNKTRFMVLARPIKENIDKYLKLRGVTYNDKDLPLIISHSSNADPKAHVNTSTVYRIVKKYAKVANIDESTISPHNMRHTFATVACGELGMTPSELQEQMGHVSIATTQKYIHTVDMIKNSPANKLANMYMD